MSTSPLPPDAMAEQGGIMHSTVVERTFSWLARFRRLRIRDERRADIHLAFLQLGCILVCLGYWLNRF